MLGKAGMVTLGRYARPVRQAIAHVSHSLGSSVGSIALKSGGGSKMDNIQTRAEMIVFFEDHMTRAFEMFVREQRLAKGQNLLKSYILEAHPLATSEDALRDARQFVHSMGETSAMALSALRDPTLFLIRSEKDYEVEGILDLYDPRFWLFHTVSRADDTSRFIQDLVRQFRQLDLAWLSSDFLRELGDIGRLEGFSIRFNSPLGRTEPEAYAGPDEEELEVLHEPDHVSLTLSMSRLAERILADFDSIHYLSNMLALASVKRRVFTDESDKYCVARITSFGRVTAKGTSAGAFLDMLLALLQRYRSLIVDYEERFVIHYREEEVGVSIIGTPMTIRISPPVPDLRAFVEEVFACKLPYRLFGVPRYVHEDYAEVKAVDLHSGAKLNLEITPDFMRVYLAPETCGNSIARLLTNLQQNLSARITIAEGPNEAIESSST